MARQATWSGTASIGAAQVGVTNWVFTPTTDAVEVTGMATAAAGGGYKSFLVGLSGGTGTCEMHWDGTGKPESIKDRAIITAALTSDAGSAVSITGNAVVTQSEISAAVDGAGSASIAFTYTSSWTETAGYA